MSSRFKKVNTVRSIYHSLYFYPICPGANHGDGEPSAEQALIGHDERDQNSREPNETRGPDSNTGDDESNKTQTKKHGINDAQGDEYDKNGHIPQKRLFGVENRNAIRVTKQQHDDSAENTEEPGERGPEIKRLL